MATFLGFPVAAASAASAPMGGLIPQESWRARLAGRFVPGAAGMSAEDRDAMVRQGLLGLAAGMASTSGQGTAGAIGNGLQSGLLALNSGAESLREQQYRQQVLDRQLGDPAGLREFNAMTDGLSDEEKAQARRVRLGIEGRASSAGIGFGEWVDANGIPRPKRENPRSGVLEVFYEEEGRWVPIGGGPTGERQSAPASPPAFATPPFSGIGADVVPIFEALRPAVERAESGGNPNAVSSAGAMGRMQVMPGTARDPGFGIQPARDNSDAELTRTGEQYLQAMLSRYADPRAALAAYNWGPGNVDKALQASGGDVDAMLQNAPAETRAYVPRVLGYAQASVPPVPRGLGRGITKADEAAQVEASKLGVQAEMAPGIAGATTAAQEAARLSYLPAELDARTQAAIAEAAGKGEVARSDAAAATAAKNAVAMQTYRTGIAGLRSGLAGTSTGYVQGMLPAVTTGQQIAEGGVSAIAPILKSIFREAGEGTFTDRDQETLMAMVPTRNDNPAAREAKLANIDAIVQAKLGASMAPQPPAAAPAQGAPRRLRYNPATGSLE